MGIAPSGEKHVIDYVIYPNASTLACKELLDFTKQRCIEEMFLFVDDVFQDL